MYLDVIFFMHLVLGFVVILVAVNLWFSSSLENFQLLFKYFSSPLCKPELRACYST